VFLADELDDQRRKVDFDTYDISVKQLLSMVADRTIDVAPEYQRHFRWGTARQSQLVESVFLGIPIPPMFMATNRDSSWEVVDGVQRLSSLIHFAASDETREHIGLRTPLQVSGLEKLPSLNGELFDRLPQTIQTQFMLRPIKVVTLSDKSDTVVRFDLFERLNTGGVRLSNQEIRACVFRGEFNDFLGELAGSADFRHVVRLPDSQQHDRTDEECVLRFFAFLHGYREFEHSVVDFLNDYMRDTREGFDYAGNRDLFTKVFGELASILPEGIHRRGRRSTPLNLFEGVAVGAALAIRQNGRLQPQVSTEWVDGQDLRGWTTGATNTQPMVAGRIEYSATQLGWIAGP
jgi:hypothetical protein